MVVIGRFGRVRVAVDNRRYRSAEQVIAVLHAVIEEHVQHVRRGHGLRKQTRDDAGERHVTKNRPHDPPDTASDVAASQTPGQRICSMTLPSFSISSP